MSPKKNKKAAPASKAVKAAKTPARKAGARMSSSAASAATADFTAAATIFVYKVGDETQVRTSPQRLGAGPGHIEWTVVNLASKDPVDVLITWKDESPWGGKEPISIKHGNYRRSLAGSKDGRYKYNVTVGDFTEDPEIEIPDN